MTLRESPFKMLREEGVPGAGVFNLRASFKVLHGAVDAGNHMSLVRLRTGKFLVIDAVDPNGHDGRVKEEIDRLTRGGRLIEAVVATHPFHTLGFLPFFKLFGARHIKFYGTPRHLGAFPKFHGRVTWAIQRRGTCGRTRDSDETSLRRGICGPGLLLSTIFKCFRLPQSITMCSQR